MKAIKKVEVTPIDQNIAKIIDSAATTDDKTKNTYSMRIIDSKVSDINTTIDNLSDSVDTALDNLSDSVDTALNTKLDNSKIVTIETDKRQWSDGENQQISYPEGFTMENSTVISIKEYAYEGNSLFQVSNQPIILNTIFGYNTFSGINIYFNPTKISVNHNGEIAEGFENLYKITLLKID